MPYGLRTRDAAGNVKLDTSNYVGHLIGSVVTGTSNGSASMNFYGGAPFAICLPLANGPGGSFNQVPQVSFSANTVSWAFDAPEQSDTHPVSCVLIIGIK